MVETIYPSYSIKVHTRFNFFMDLLREHVTNTYLFASYDCFDVMCICDLLLTFWLSFIGT